MKITLVCRAYPTQRPGGMPFVCQDRAEALATKAHEIHVLTTGGGPAEQELNGVLVHHLDCPTQQYTDQFAQACIALCNNLQPDILHLDSIDRARPWWHKRPGNPKVVAVTMHGFGLGSWLSQWNLFLDGQGKPPPLDVQALKDEVECLRVADRVIGISKHEYWQLRDVYNLKQARIVYNPIAPYFFNLEINDPPPNGFFICIGNPGTSRNRHFGDAEKAASKIGATIRVVKETPRHQIPTLYRGAKALVLPTFWSQGYDLTVTEALACRRPVIATNTGSYGWEGLDNPSIILVPRSDLEALTQAMQGPMPTVPANTADRHRPDIHAENWLSVMQELL